MKILLFLITCFFCVSLQSVFSHSGSTSFEKQVDEYLFDIGYDPETLESGSGIRFTFSLYSLASTTKELANYNNIWTRITHGDTVLYTAWLHRPSFGTPALTYMFPKEGEYELAVRFLKEDGLDNITVSDTTFPISITKGKGQNNFTTHSFGIALFVGTVLGYVISRFYTKKSAIN